MPTYLIAGTVSTLIKCYDNWGSDHYEDRNGELRFDAKNIEAARKYVDRVCAERKVRVVHGLYILRGDEPVLVSLMTKRGRRKLMRALEFAMPPKDRKSLYPMIKKLSDGELQQLVDQTRPRVLEPLQAFKKREEMIDAILKLLNPVPPRRKLVQAYLKEFPEKVLEHIFMHVQSWKEGQGRKEMFISAFLSDHLRPVVSKELFGQ